MIGKRAAEAAQAMVAAGDYETLGRLLSSRYSCRGFLPEPVPREDIERILAVAQRTASWCNAQPWQVVVTSGDATERFRRRLLEGAREPVEADKPDFAWPREYRDVYLQRRRECGFALYHSVGVARGDREGGERRARNRWASTVQSTVARLFPVSCSPRAASALPASPRLPWP